MYTLSGKEEQELISQLIGMIEKDEKYDTGELGRDENTVRTVPYDSEQEQRINDNLSLHIISLRISNDIMDIFKERAKSKNMKYQTLMNQVLYNYAYDIVN